MSLELLEGGLLSMTDITQSESYGPVHRCPKKGTAALPNHVEPRALQPWGLLMRGRPMKLLREYLSNAEACRKLASQTAEPEQRKAIEQICETWEKLAEERRKALGINQPP